MKGKHQKKLVLIATILGSGVVILDGTIVNLALPKIGISLHVGLSAFQWIVDGYLLSLSSLILLGGSLGDILGRKKIYLTGLVGFGIFSLLCALAPSSTILIITRIVQGAFGAMLVPGALSIINTNFPIAERGKAIGAWTAGISIPVVAGPLVGGLILSIASWRWIFLINVPLIAACFLLALPSIKESKDNYPRKIDLAGAFLAAATLAAVTYGLIEGPAAHWTARPILSIVIGLIFAIAFVRYERKVKDPMVKLALFKSRNFLGANLMTLAMYGALGGLTFSLVIFLQTHIGYSSIKAGLSLLPVSITLFLFSSRVGRLASKIGPRIFMTVGPILSGVGIASFYFLRPGDSYIAHIFPGSLLFAAGMALTVSPLTTTVMTSISNDDSGIASGINNAISRAAGLIVIAFLGLLGAANFFHVAVILCAGLAIISGIISYSIIVNHPLGNKLKV